MYHAYSAAAFCYQTPHRFYGYYKQYVYRLQIDRENIPAYHQHQLTLESEKLKRAEERLRLKEEGLRAEMESGANSVEALRRSCLDEHCQMRARYEDDLQQARLELEKRRQELDNEKEVFSLKRLADANELEGARVQNTLKERHLMELQASIGRSKIELELSQRLIEPGVCAAEADRKEARRVKAQADGVLRAAEEYASAVTQAEQGTDRTNSRLENDLLSLSFLPPYVTILASGRS